VSIWDCWLLSHCLWTQPESQRAIHDWYATRVGTSAAMDPTRLTRIIVSWEARLQQDQENRSQGRDTKRRLLFQGPDGKPTFEKTGSIQIRRGGDPVFLAPEGAHEQSNRHYSSWQPIDDRTREGKGYTRAELDGLLITDPREGQIQFSRWSKRDAYMSNPANWLKETAELPPWLEPTRQKPAYLESVRQDLDTLRVEVEAYAAGLETHIATLESDIRAHLWVTPDFVEPASRNLNETRREVATLLARVARVRSGFDRLPLEQEVSLAEDDAPVSQTPEKSKKGSRR
jgi:MoxR-like ATPase